jgi:hypothetical protein
MIALALVVTMVVVPFVIGLTAAAGMQLIRNRRKN